MTIGEDAVEGRERPMDQSAEARSGALPAQGVPVSGRLPVTVELRGGRSAVLRPVESDDKDRLAGAFDRLSRDSRYRRFFRPLDELSAGELAYLTEIDHRDHEALIALDPETDAALGVARYVRSRTDPRQAEAAVAVVDDWQGRGLGRALLGRLSDRAREEAVERFTALVQADNRRAIEALSALGHTERVRRDGVVELQIELRNGGLGPRLASALRAAAGSTFGTRELSERISRSARELFSARSEPIAAPKSLTGPIVVGTDGSDSAARAVQRAAELADSLGAPLHLVTGYRPVPEWRLRAERLEAPRDVAWRINPREDAEAVLRGAVADLSNDGRPDPGAHAREGDPADVLIRVADELDAQLIVVGNKGMTGASRFLLGSVPNKVSHHAPRNVLIEHTTDRHP